MSDFASQPDEAVDRWLADQRRAVVNDLATTLDLEAGLHETMIPARHADLVADLRDVLDVEAGLSAIVPAASDGSSEADPKEATPDPQLTTNLHELVRVIASASPASRLAMRIRPTPILAHALACAHDDADAINRSLALVLDRCLVRDHDLARDLALVRDLVRDLALVRDSVLALVLTRVRVRFLARVRVRVLARDHDHLLACALDLSKALDKLHRALSDFTGTDLRHADLAGVPLDGLRWSATTQWPLDWVERIERDSVEVEPGIFQVRGGTTYAPTAV